MPQAALLNRDWVFDAFQTTEIGVAVRAERRTLFCKENNIRMNFSNLNKTLNAWVAMHVLSM